ncbi:threonylcarbamoyl-AMP synthase [Acidisoma cellulosilytica]|uniref:Threonylcarbamoyl-AMP synthase n=1 Tax=Acidisoma cellulosilyticum TaxID=2802395 RepID=A0A963Z1B2_9PROT|nr:L-threonylcarbamoyladenylate synthase [Acidisoma cellulosilyticum]MCB8880167.1 threonylcarbamoyl-AMP synthase [Acidisoma cellulosilyticum]
METLVLSDDESGLDKAAALLRAGKLVAFPTETVYGLGADATDAGAVAAIYTAKDRPGFNPLIAHYANTEAAFADVIPTPLAETLAAAFWPGPLTLVLPRRPDCRVAEITGAGLATQAVRVPAHPLAHRLLTAVGKPVAAPSANRSGRVSPTTAGHVLDGLSGRIAAVIDGGACAVGLESTVVDLSGDRPALLRAGGITVEMLAAYAPDILVPDSADQAAPRSPGQLLAHYAPELPLRLQAETVGADEALLAFGPALTGAAAVFNLSEGSDLTEAAARLFAGLRMLDKLGRAQHLRGIAAMALPEHGIGCAINDRLRRAAHGAGESGTMSG